MKHLCCAVVAGALAAPWALAEDHVLVGFDLIEGSMFSVDVGTAQVVLGPGASPANPQGLAYDSGSGTMYAVNGITNELYKVDPFTGNSTLIGDLGLNDIGDQPRFGSLAYQESTGSLFSVDTNDSRKRLYSIDPATAQKTLIADTAARSLGALDFDPFSGRLYGVDMFDDTLVEIDPLTGAVSSIVQIGSVAIGGLAFHPETGVLYGLEGFSHNLVEIDPIFGDVSVIGDTGLHGVESLEFVTIPTPATLGVLLAPVPLRARRRR